MLVAYSPPASRVKAGAGRVGRGRPPSAGIHAAACTAGAARPTARRRSPRCASPPPSCPRSSPRAPRGSGRRSPPAPLDTPPPPAGRRWPGRGGLAAGRAGAGLADGRLLRGLVADAELAVAEDDPGGRADLQGSCPDERLVADPTGELYGLGVDASGELAA